MVSSLINARTCLRCQFPDVLHRTQLQHSPHSQCRGFFSSHRFRQDTSDDLLKREKPYYWKRLHGGERVVGKPGRRQRVVSEGLSTASLGKPANVIVFRDFKEEPSRTVPAREDGKQPYGQDDGEQPKTSISAQEIEHAIAARHAAPRDEEVHASIDALRPDETIQSQHAFEKFQQSLAKSYTFQQLSRYLVRSLQDGKTAIKSKNIQRLEASQWQPGQTPLQQRRDLVVVKKTTATRKSALVDQILRLVWHITIHSEAQEIGELEVKVRPWQLSMLFDLEDNGKPYYESLIGSKILLDACQIHSWPADSTLRITGRRQDAEEVARQLKLAMLEASRLQLDLKAFMPLIMKDAHRDNLSNFLSNDNIRYVSELTKTVLEIRESGIIYIYGLQDSARNNARRLLVALLELPGLCSCEEIFTVSERQIGRGDDIGRRCATTIPAANQSIGLHRRYHEFELGRPADQVGALKAFRAGSGDGAALISTKGAAVYESDHSAMPLEPIAKALSSRLGQLPEPSTNAPGARHDPHSYWRAQAQVDDWEAEYCTALSEYSAPNRAAKSQKKKKTATKPKSTTGVNKLVIQRTVPGVETLLSYFEATHVHQALQHSSDIDTREQHGNRPRSRFDPRMPYLSAHFVPFTSQVSITALPRLELRFRLLPSTPGQVGDRGLLLTKIRAVLDTQTVVVPLPHCLVDMRFTRDATLSVDVRVARKDDAIRTFVQKLQDSVNADEGALHGPSELSFKLPHSLIYGSEGSATAKSDVEVPYLLERFEQTQRTVFTAPDSHASSTFLAKEIQTSLGAFSDSMTLDYREVEGGAIYGKSMRLCIRHAKASSTATSTHGQERIPPSGEPQVDASPLSDDDTSTHPSTEVPALASEGSSANGESHERVGQTGSTSLSLATAGLQIANLLTRASSGSLLRMGEER